MGEVECNLNDSIPQFSQLLKNREGLPPSSSLNSFLLIFSDYCVTISPYPVLCVISLLGQQVSMAIPFLVFQSFVIVNDPHLILVSPNSSVWFVVIGCTCFLSSPSHRCVYVSAFALFFT